MADITKEKLEDLYTNQGLSVRKCAEALGLPTHGSIPGFMKKFGIPARVGGFQKGNRINKGLKREDHPSWKGGKQVVFCDECGKRIEKWPSHVMENNFCSHACRAKSRSADMTGNKIGMLTVVKQAGRDKHNHILWECSCDCGGSKVVNTSDLASVKSCGCLSHLKGEDNPIYVDRVDKSCAYCGKTLKVLPNYAASYENSFCKGTDCRGKWMSENLSGDDNPKWVKRVDVNCTYCGEPLEPRTPSMASLYANRFCKGTDCHAKWKSDTQKGGSNSNYHGGTPERRKVGHRVSAAMRKAIRQQKAGRHWEELVDYSLEDLIVRLKSTMPEGYTWEDDFVNGGDILHIDHIIPMSSFNFESAEHIDFKRCFALDNLQLLPAIENMQKSAKLDCQFQPSMAFG